MLEMPELAFRGREKLLADPYVLVHRATDIQKQQDLHGVAPFRYELQIEQSRSLRRGGDRAFQIQLIGRAFDEATLVRIGAAFQRATDYHQQVPKLA